MRYQRVKAVAWRRVGEETVIVNLGRRRMLAVNEAGGAVWEALAEEAPVLPDEAAHFLADLEAEGVVERRAPGEPGAEPGTESGIEACSERGAGSPAAITAAVPPGWVPVVVWREELHNFGACAFFPGMNELCNQNPSRS